MINKESDIRPIGYGGDAAGRLRLDHRPGCRLRLEPGDYFKINIAAGHARTSRPPTTPQSPQQATPPGRSTLGLQPNGSSTSCKRATGEKNLAGKVGGAVTLAVGMAKVFARSARHEAADGLLVSLRDHVRGPLHPHAAGDRHPRGPLRLPGVAGPVPSRVADRPTQPNWVVERRR